MPAVVLVAHDARTGPDLPPDDLPGIGGRFDVVCRVLTTALLTSHGIRRDWQVDLVLQGPPDPPRRVLVDGADVTDLNPDERSTAMLLAKVLAEPTPGKTLHEVRDGIRVSGQGLADVLDDRQAAGPILLLGEEGEDVDAVDLPDEAAFVVSDHRDLTADEADVVRARADGTIRLGPTALHASQAVAVLQNRWDRRR